MSKSKAGPGGRKHGRNLKKCQRYRAEHRAEKNAAKRKAKRERQMPNASAHGQGVGRA